MFWAHESLSLYGLYPGTTPMGSIIVASALTEVTNLSVHDYQLVHSFLFSLVATLSFFMLSGEFSNNYRTRWFSSLCFSLAPLFLSLTLWRLSLRFSFISFLPLFIWSLLRISNKKYGRNDKIKISNGSETKIIKFKKAENLLNQGWNIVE